jgi:Trk K+ transport system NAD-binding subunit
MILFSEHIYKIIHKYLGLIEFRKEARKVTRKEKDFEAIIFGYKRAGPEFAKIFQKNNIKFLVVDLNPDIIKKLEKENINAEYGDASDLEFLSELPTKNLKIVVSTIPDFDINMLITRFIRRGNNLTSIMVMADFKNQALKLYDEGATHVVLSHYIGAKQTSIMISKLGFKHDSYENLRKKHVLDLSDS